MNAILFASDRVPNSMSKCFAGTLAAQRRLESCGMRVIHIDLLEGVARTWYAETSIGPRMVTHRKEVWKIVKLEGPPMNPEKHQP